jgi:lactate dehydrogenase-like 2-hydroxyacid dehydrogenase
MTVVDRLQADSSVEELAARWLADLERALSSGDAGAATALFASGGHWRDILAFSWHLHTFTGHDRIRQMLDDKLSGTAPRAFRLHHGSPPRAVRRAGVDAIEALFDFETASGRAKGVVRLVRAEDGGVRAWTLLTALQELRGFEERRGDRRPRGEEYSRNFGGANWLDKRRAEQEYRDRDPAVLVVGGGQAGLGVAARLKTIGVDTLIVDRMERVGDNWRNRYHSLTLHNEVWVNSLPYVPFPDTWPVYVPKDKLANWFEAYVETMELNFWTSTEFVSGTYDDSAKRWDVRLRRGDGTERVMHPRHVVMAWGVSGVPSIPDIPGLSDFQGTTLHSGAFTDGREWAGKKALVVGTGNSGHDVAQDLYSHGAQVTMVQRSSTTVVNVEPTAQKIYSLYSEGPPIEDCDLVLASIPYPMLVQGYQLGAADMAEEDKELVARLEAIGFRTDWGEDATGFQMKYLRRGGGYYLNVGCSDLLIEGEIGLVQYADIDRITAEGALLRDGTTVPADLIVLATGYKSQQELLRTLCGDEIADRVGPIWGFDAAGELRNMWKRTPQEGLWFMAGSLAQCRIFSRYLAVQIKAVEEGLIEPTMPAEALAVPREEVVIPAPAPPASVGAGV